MKKFFSASAGLLLQLVFLSWTAAGAENQEPEFFIKFDSSETLQYGADSQGNRIPDFSHCGYEGGDKPIPHVPVRVIVEPVEGDNTARVQAAIDYVSSLPLNADGFRGAVLLRRGRYILQGGLILRSSGVVLRGEGMDEDGTVLIAAGTDRRTLIRIVGKNDRSGVGQAVRVQDEIVPVGSYSLRLENTEGLSVGDTVVIIRPSTREWIEQIGMNRFGGGLKGQFDWKAGSRDIRWDRVIRAVDGGRVVLDAPLTAALEQRWGGGTVQKYQWPGRIHHIGVENLRCVSEYNRANPKDENHSWMAVTIENAENVWVRRLTAVHFAGSLAAVWETAKWVTVEDCLFLEPVSEEGGWRRNPFFTVGQMTLFLRCWSERGRHDFSVGYCAPGPNAFVQCWAKEPLEDSGPLESWACGVLYDNVRIDGNALRVGHRGSRGEGIGWSGANCVLWQCDAAIIECAKPPTAWNWAFGCWAEFEGDGWWEQSNNFVKPDSLYQAQLARRLGKEAASRIRLWKVDTSGTTNPSYELAAELAVASSKPMPTLAEFIWRLTEEYPIVSDTSAAQPLEKVWDETMSRTVSANPPDKQISLVNGRIVCRGRLLTGASTGVAWWRGTTRPDEAPSFGIGITRFVPGRIGRGFTDDLEELTSEMAASGKAVLDYNYGLWYDRRRDDHQRVRRMNGDVRPPFYEQPFDRSGIGTAWDGLSRYDLTRYNAWYWARLREFADLCERKGLVLLHQNYFQHNVLEAGAHWADCPWRPANNINDTGFPEPPPYAGDKRIFLAHLFYDVSHPGRRALHQAYIRQCLDAFADYTNVIQMTSAEYTGPAEFVRFWLDTIRQWKLEKRKNPLTALSCTKDVQDVILSEPKYRELVSVIDIRYWWYQQNGAVYAPQGGKNLAPRQHARLLNPKPASFEQVVRAVREYRERYPDKAVIYSADSRFGWAVLLGGGSLPPLPPQTDPGLLEAVVKMEPFDWPGDSARCFALADVPKQYLVYVAEGKKLPLPVQKEGETFEIRRVDLETGQTASVHTTEQKEWTTESPALYWILKR